MGIFEILAEVEAKLEVCVVFASNAGEDRVFKAH